MASASCLGCCRPPELRAIPCARRRFIEGVTRDLYLDDPHEVEVYRLTFRRLADLAAGPSRSREMIAAMIASYDRRLR
jgi:Domain of unknown function (DUF5753)